MAGFLVMKVPHRGFSLIEALVSLLVLSVGVLGLCRLQVALWSSSSALHATALAFEHPVTGERVVGECPADF